MTMIEIHILLADSPSTSRQTSSSVCVDQPPACSSPHAFRPILHSFLRHYLTES